MTPEMLAELRKPFPPEALEVKKIQGKAFTYINHSAVTTRLLRVTEGSYSFTIISDQFVPWGENEKGPIFVHLVHGRITIGQEHWDGQGVATIYPNAGEDMLKAAASDALKKCVTRIGVGLDLYGSDMEAELALDTYQPQDTTLPKATVDQRTYIQALWKQAGHTIQDKKGHLHHDADKLDRWLKSQYGGHGLLDLTIEEAAHVLDRMGAKKEEA